MALVTGRSGKCSNFGNCSVADARKTVDVPAGLDFVCTECGKPLLLLDTNTASSNTKMLVMGALLLVVLLAAGGVAWSLFAGKKTTVVTDVPAPQVIAPSPTAKPEAETKPEAKNTEPQAPLYGNCSDADAKAGLCRAKP